MKKSSVTLRWVGVALFALLILGNGFHWSSLLFAAGLVLLLPIPAIQEWLGTIKLKGVLSVVLAVVLLFAGSLASPLSTTDVPGDGQPTVSDISSSTTTTTASTSDGTTTAAKLDEGNTTTLATFDEATTTTTSKPTTTTKVPVGSTANLNDVPAYSGKAYAVLNNNTPKFSSAELTTSAYEKYSPLDSLGRCGIALASCGKEIMPGADEERGSISSITPSGWKQAKYDGVSGGYLWNRCHLIGWQLSAENANKQNLITGTRSMNVDGMLPFENMIADYIKETGNHVAFRVTPHFKGSNLVCSGVQMEAYSIEDDGDGICFNVYCYNVQPGITINYADGSSSKGSSATSSKSITTTTTKKVATSTAPPDLDDDVTVYKSKTGKKYHCKPNCGSMKNGTPISLEEAKELGLTACGNCY